MWAIPHLTVNGQCKAPPERWTQMTMLIIESITHVVQSAASYCTHWFTTCLNYHLSVFVYILHGSRQFVGGGGGIKKFLCRSLTFKAPSNSKVNQHRLTTQSSSWQRSRLLSVVECSFTSSWNITWQPVKQVIVVWSSLTNAGDANTLKSFILQSQVTVVLVLYK